MDLLLDLLTVLGIELVIVHYVLQLLSGAGRPRLR